MARTISGVPTSIAAFVGYTRTGTPDEAQTLTSFGEFEHVCGGLDRDSPLSYAVRQFFANGGTQASVVRVAPSVDGTRAGAAEIVGSPSQKTGMHALLDVDLFNILSVPETFDMSDADAAAVIAAAVDLCERRRAFYIVDAPSAKSLADIAAWANGATCSRNAAVYFPALRVADPLDGLRPRTVAPSGTLAGVYARTDSDRGVWKTPAGAGATLDGVLDLALAITDAQNATLNREGVNALRSFPAHGCVAWGARTRRGSDALGDEYKHVPVRRLALFLEESLHRGTQWVVSEPNDESSWAQIRTSAGVFLQELFRQGVFPGRTPRDAYFVKCDRETTTQDDIDLGVVNLVVGFAPLRPAEFVVLKLGIAAPIPT